MPDSEVTIRELRADDRTAATRLRTEAFGPAMVPGAERPWPHPGSTGYGAFEADQDGTELLIGTAYARRYDSHVHGGLVRTCGVAGVTVAADRRGAGLLAPTLERLLDAQREEGAVIATLFPSQPGIYRRFGFEVITECFTVDVPLAGLRELSRAADLGEGGPGAVTVRRARVEDVPAVRACYDAWAATANGPLSRRGASFPAGDEELLASVTELYLARDADGRVVGYVSLQRNDGVGPDTVVSATDLICLTQPARIALLRLLAGFDAVAGAVRLRVTGEDETVWHRRAGWVARTPHPPYMLAVLDVVAAVAALAPPPGLRGTYPIVVTGPAPVAGAYEIEVADGRAVARRTEPGGPGGPGGDAAVFSPRGLAVWWAGAGDPGSLRTAGLLGGPSTHDADLAALPGRRPIRILDAF